ncbi:MAG: LysM peptidoglycan-binding domain-containing protein [Halothiobacillaceae bacterium]|nr:LysM peptidoglycan-binding domain-containing protein [Halothiobacillaceae bacterium]
MFHPRFQWSLLAVPLLLSACASTPDAPVESSATASAAQAAPASVAAPLASVQPFRKQAPQMYTVQKGDTLWDLAQKFLNNPADWRKIWYANPQVRNPDLIFPGDQLEIVTINGQQRLSKKHPGEKGEKIVPHVRISPLDKAIPTLPFDMLRGFLSYPQIIEVPILNDAPRVVGSPSDRLVLGAGDRFYAYGSALRPDELLSVVRPKSTLYDPVNGEVLGYEADDLGVARVIVNDDPATLTLVKANLQVGVNDRLVAIPPVLTRDLVLLPPRDDLQAVVISLPEQLTRISQWQVAAINAGKREGVEPGQVLRISRPGTDSSADTTPIVDMRAVQESSPFPPNDGKPPVVELSSSASFALPAKPLGDAVVFLTYERVSYVLVTQTTRPVQVGDCMGSASTMCH